MTPYYCYRDYDVSKQCHSWSVTVTGRAGYQDQDPDVARIQYSVSVDFDPIFYQMTVPLTFVANGTVSSSAWIGTRQSLPYPTVHYARVRYETTDGGTVGPWSNVFELDGGNEGANHVNRVNVFTRSGYTKVNETHWLGNATFYNVSSESVYKDGHTYALLGQTRWLYETNSVTRDHSYGSLYLADYDGSTVTLTQIGSEVEDWGTSGSPVHYDVVEFNDKLYAGWHDPANAATSLYDWCEITGGVVGTIYHVAIPAEATGSTNWATIAIIYGRLRVITSLDTGAAYVMGIADVLAADPTMKVYGGIKTGYGFTKDPWLQSIWFDYTNYDDTETGICWLGSGQSNAVWFMQI
jgi:hypothetical protein